MVMDGETVQGQLETSSEAGRLYLAGCMDRWCPGLSDSVSVRLSLHTAELSVLESFPSV